MAEDRRVRYTKKMIREAFFTIFEQKELDKITVKEICEAADINRATFYRNYEDIYDLFHKIEEELIHEILDNHSEEIDLNSFFEVVYKNQAFYRGYIRSGQDRSRIKASIEKFFQPLQENAGNGFAMSYYLGQYIVQGTWGIIRAWLENGCKEPIDEMVKILEELIGNNMDIRLLQRAF